VFTDCLTSADASNVALKWILAKFIFATQLILPSLVPLWYLQTKDFIIIGTSGTYGRPSCFFHMPSFNHSMTTHEVNSISSIPIPLNSIWSIPHQIYQFNSNSQFINSNFIFYLLFTYFFYLLFLPTTFYHE